MAIGVWSAPWMGGAICGLGDPSPSYPPKIGRRKEKEIEAGNTVRVGREGESGISQDPCSLEQLPTII